MLIMRAHKAYGGEISYHLHQTVEATVGEAILLPGLERKATVQVTPGSGATVQVTASHPNVVEADNATWIDWTQGNINQPTILELPERVTAIRLVDDSDSSSWDVLV